MAEEKDFFRECTLSICSSLEIEKSLSNCLNLISQYIPADFAGMLLLNSDLGILEMIAYEGVKTDRVPLTITMTQESRSHYKELLRHMDRLSRVTILNQVTDDPLVGSILVSAQLEDPMLLIMWLKIDAQILGFVVIGNTRQISYTQHHADLLSQLNEPFAIAFSNHMRYRELSRLRDLLMDDNRYFQDELRRRTGGEIIGANLGLKQVMEWVRQVAPQSSPVILLGETGTGKEMIANAIHNLSPRKDGPLIKVNCGAIPESLIDSELFGHEKGSFTGAVAQKRGRFERANGGTIFLDEIGELPLNAQVRLLRVIQEKEIERVGGANPIQVDIRIIAATHRDLLKMVKENKFREDLYFRLCVFPIMIPPLHERREDIPALVHHFVQRKVREMGLASIPSIPPRSFDKLMSYSWPGNVRELQNVIERALILSQGKPLTFDHLDEPLQSKDAAPKVMQPNGFAGFDEAVSEYILRTLKMTNGKIFGKGGAACLLDINPSTLRKKISKLGIAFDRHNTGASDEENHCALPEKDALDSGDILTLDQFISQYILKAMEKSGGKVAGRHGAADLLQINPSTLRKKMIKLNIAHKEI